MIYSNNMIKNCHRRSLKKQETSSFNVTILLTYLSGHTDENLVYHISFPMRNEIKH